MPDREKTIKGLEYCSELQTCFGCPYCKGSPTCQDDLCKDALQLIKEQPEIIRCKDCKNWKPGEIVRDNFIPPRCDLNGGGWSSDNYCSWAIRKED